jgi:hypothetical protein
LPFQNRVRSIIAINIVAAVANFLRPLPCIGGRKNTGAHAKFAQHNATDEVSAKKKKPGASRAF